VQLGQTVPSHPVPSRRTADRTGRSRTPDTGEVLEARVAQLWFWEGFYSRSAVDLTRHFDPEPLQVTDLDLLAFDLNPHLSPRKYIGEVKSGTGKNAPKALDRLVWLRGLRELVDAESAELTIAATPSERVREVARSLGLVAQSVHDFERREQDSVAGFDDCGAQGAGALELRMRVRDICRGDPELERAFGFLRSRIWFLEPFLAVKQVIDILRRMARRWHPRVQDDEAQALRWILAESVSVLTLNLVIISGHSLTLERPRFSQLVSDRLAEGMIPMPQMRRISDSIDKYVNGVLSAANVPPDVRTSAIGAFLPEAPDWAEPLAEVAWRMGRSAIQARSLPRQIDLLVHERVARKREVPEQAAHRIGLERQDTARLRNLLAAFLRGCDASPGVVDDALTSVVPLPGAAKEEATAMLGQLMLSPGTIPMDSDQTTAEPTE
jgi:hypothetical protein